MLYYCSSVLTSEFGCHDSTRARDVFCLQSRDHPRRLLEGSRHISISDFPCQKDLNPNTGLRRTRGHCNEGLNLRQFTMV